MLHGLSCYFLLAAYKRLLVPRSANLVSVFLNWHVLTRHQANVKETNHTHNIGFGLVLQSWTRPFFVQERLSAEKINRKLRQQLADFKVPEVMQYVEVKADLYDLEKKVRSWERKVEIASVSGTLIYSFVIQALKADGVIRSLFFTWHSCAVICFYILLCMVVIFLFWGDVLMAVYCPVLPSVTICIFPFAFCSIFLPKCCSF